MRAKQSERPDSKMNSSTGDRHEECGKSQLTTVYEEKDQEICQNEIQRNHGKHVQRTPSLAELLLHEAENKSGNSDWYQIIDSVDSQAEETKTQTIPKTPTDNF